MTHLKTLSPEEASGKTKELFTVIHNKLGMIPNMMKTMGNSPALLEGYLALSNALGKGSISTATGELIALTVAEANSCDYCLSAHTYIGEKLLGIDSQTLLNSRSGKSGNAKTDAALRFAHNLVSKKGLVNEQDLQEVKFAGFTDGEIGEIIGHVALNILTNYLNNAANTEIDFPIVRTSETVVK